MNSPLTPQQALNNFTLIQEIIPIRRDFGGYIAQVRAICETALAQGILGDDQHPASSDSAILDWIGDDPLRAGELHTYMRNHSWNIRQAYAHATAARLEYGQAIANEDIPAGTAIHLTHTTDAGDHVSKA